MEIVASYEDVGRSGVQLSNRPRLQQLLQDVAQGAPYAKILVHDVSRWGRFQDADASAYYEYHCRLHGVDVVYVSESFPNDQTPTSVLLKSMRRVMAAEYSRDIARKSRAGQERVVSMGFQMGPLPALGYRRCSVSADGSRRLMLEKGQRKAALSDRIEWVLGPPEEVRLVKRICTAYASGLELEEIANLMQSTGYLTDKRRPFTSRAVKALLQNEALIGNFVWGVKSKGGKVLSCSPTRRNGSVPRIIDDALWLRIADRIASARAEALRRLVKQAAVHPRTLAKSTGVRQLSLPFPKESVRGNFRRGIGTPHQIQNQTREFGKELCGALRGVGLEVGFDSRSNVLSFWGARIQIRLIWPSSETTWDVRGPRSLRENHHLLAVRMQALSCPVDFFLFPPERALLLHKVGSERDRQLRGFHCVTPSDLVSRLAQLSKLQPSRT